MSNPGSITKLAKRLAANDSVAAAAIWNIFVQDLINLARQRINPRIRSRLDPDDVVQSAFKSFFQGASAGRFNFPDRHHLKSFLISLVLNKACNAAAHHSRDRRDYRREHTEANLGNAIPVNEWLANTPTPLAIAAFRDQFDYLISKLSNDNLRTIVHMKFQGMTNEEIALSYQCCQRSIERKIERIRAEWRSVCGIAL